MAGDWLKLECSTPDKPEVFAITAKMGWDDPDLTVGKLFRVWRWFDQQTTNGNASGVTPSLLDRIAGATGFAQAMESAGWLTVTPEGLELPNFEKHNGATAKARCQTAKRVANHRASGECNAKAVTTALAREEKRREDKSIAPGKPAKFDPISFLVNAGASEDVARDFLAVRKVKKQAPTQTAFNSIVHEVEKAGISMQTALEVCCQKGWAGFKASWDRGNVPNIDAARAATFAGAIL